MCVSIVTSKSNTLLCFVLFSCILGYSGTNCSIAACDREDACPPNEYCKMNSIFILGGYVCIPRACSKLNCTANETCGRLSNAGEYMCLSDPCISESNCNSTNGGCTYDREHNNFTCTCKPGYDQVSGCNIELPCHETIRDRQCRNGGTCVKNDNRDIKTCNCNGGECLCFCVHVYL